MPITIVREQTGSLAAVIPYEPYLFLRAENEALTLQRLKPRSRLARSIAALAESVKGQLTQRQTAAPSSREENWARAFEDKVSRQIWEALGRTDGLRAKTNAHLEALLETEFQTALTALNINATKEEIEAARQNIKDHVMGLGPLQKIMREPGVTEIMVNGENEIYVEREGELEKTTGSFSSRAQLLTVIDRVVSGGGRRVDMSSPLCDARLSDGSRVNVVLPPLSLQGPLLTVRRFRDNLLSLDDLEKKGTLTAAQAHELQKKVRERMNIVVAGNSGSGKTTLLNILSGFIDPNERVITIEDSAELRLQQPHVVRLETRPPNADGVGAVGVSELVVNALRMRPDRLVIGECRGAEVIPMLQAMNTGHDGSMTTVHANSARDALARLESMVLLGAPHWPIDVVRAQIHSAIDAIVFLKREGAQRKLVEIMNVFPD
jgi:pilus assembly protein CpaF